MRTYTALKCFDTRLYSKLAWGGQRSQRSCFNGKEETIWQSVAVFVVTVWGEAAGTCAGTFGAKAASSHFRELRACEMTKLE